MGKTSASDYVIIDLCSGLGTLSLAASGLGMEPIAGVDINPYAIKTFSQNFPQAIGVLGDVANKDTINKCEEHRQKYCNRKLLIVSGPPCQGFSVAGSRDVNDPRNDVMVEVAKAVVKLNPDCALLENVSAILSERNSPKIKKTLRILKNGGYNVYPFILNALNYGVPQRRIRAIFFVTKIELNAEELKLVFKSLERSPITVGDALRDLPKPKVRPDEYLDEKDCGLVYNHFTMQHSEKVIKKIKALKPGTGPLSYRRLDLTSHSNTLISGHRAPPAHPTEARSITVREAARLQGIPDSVKIWGPFSKQMEQVTNAVPLPLGMISLEVLLKALN